MPLAHRIEKVAPKSRFELWLEKLSPQNHAIVHGWLTDLAEPSAKVARAVREDDPDDGFVGYPAATATIISWRQKHVAS